MGEYDSGVFCHRLAAIRAERGMTQDELAEMSGVSRSSIAKYESGRHTPSVEIVAKLAKALDCSLDVLAGRTDITR